MEEIIDSEFEEEYNKLVESESILPIKITDFYKKKGTNVPFCTSVPFICLQIRYFLSASSFTISSSSISNFNVLFGPMSLPAPRSP